MLLKFALISYLSTVFAYCPTPASITKALRIQECHTDVDHPLKVVNLTVTNSEGIQKYPVNIGKPFHAHVVVVNNGNVVRSMLSDANIQVYKDILWFPCAWRTLPTFGFLENMKACVGCPLLPGTNKITFRFDPSEYALIVSWLGSGVPYAVEVVARDGNHSKTELACIRIEGVIEK